MTSPFEITRIIDDIEKKLLDVSSQVDCAIACISGGVDSTVSAILTRRILGERVYPVFIDTGFMRTNEAHNVKRSLREIIDIEVYDFSENFISRLEGLSDAEEKRKLFRSIFYESVKKIANEKKCNWIIQGTIKADVIETISGLKSQHNVLDKSTLERYGLKVIEPLVELYKYEVRALAEYLNIPKFIVQRQPFPGPGLLIRTVGKLDRIKLEIVRKLTDIVENTLANRDFSQYFPALWEYNVVETSRINNIEYDVFEVKVTGVTEGKRSYGHPVVIRQGPESMDVYSMFRYIDTVKHPHVLIRLAEKTNGLYLVALRIVKTRDFMSAEVPRIGLDELKPLVQRILEYPEIRAVALDITPKPPATIEFE